MHCQTETQGAKDMAIGLVRKWSDVGAPKLWANVWGSLPNLLKTVLVDGYGSFAPLGWTHEYSSPDNTRMVFRNSQEGTGTFLKVNQSNDGRAQYLAEISSFESMGSIDDFAMSRCPPVGNLQHIPVGTSAAASCTDGIHWYIIGDNLGFWLVWRPYLSQYTNALSTGKSWYVTYIGDYIPIDISINKNWFQAGYPLTSTAYGVIGPVQQGTTTSTSYACLRGGSVKDEGSVFVGLSSGSLFEVNNIGQTYQISPLNNVLHFTVPIIYDVIKSQPAALGFLPGLVNPLTRQGNNGVSDVNLQDSEISMGNKTVHLFKYKPNNNATYDMLCTIGIVSGEGFRNVI